MQHRILRKVVQVAVSSVENLVTGRGTARLRKGMPLGPTWQAVAVAVAIVSSVVSLATGPEIALLQAALHQGLRQGGMAEEGVDMVVVDVTENIQCHTFACCLPSFFSSLKPSVE